MSFLRTRECVQLEHHDITEGCPGTKRTPHVDILREVHVILAWSDAQQAASVSRGWLDVTLARQRAGISEERRDRAHRVEVR
jgi:hypothetical protein